MRLRRPDFILMALVLATGACASSTGGEPVRADDKHEHGFQMPDGRPVVAHWDSKSQTLSLEYSTAVDRSEETAVENEVDVVWRESRKLPEAREARKVYIHVRFPHAESELVTNLTTGFSYERGDDGRWFRRAGFSREKRAEPIAEP